jgi:hypothetical protein
MAREMCAECPFNPATTSNIFPPVYEGNVIFNVKHVGVQVMMFTISTTIVFGMNLMRM